jgi:hypothetical protein
MLFVKTLQLKTSFEDAFGEGKDPTSYQFQNFIGETLIPTEQNVFVHECRFIECSSDSSGGALQISSSVSRLLVEQSSFFCCRTLGSNGGGIYYDIASGECVLSRVCAFNCSSTYGSGYSYGQFAYINADNRKHVNDSSITHTLYESKSSRYALVLNNGNILCPSVNITNNECRYYPALRFVPTGAQSTYTCNISYSSIVNNTAKDGYGYIDLNRYPSSHFIYTCNILNNNQTDTSRYATIYAYANVLVKDSCILGNNKGNRVFYEDYSSCKITISNCTIDDDIFTSGRYYGSVTFSQSIERTFINALSHIQTQKCDSYFDSYGILSVKPNIPSKRVRYFLSCDCQQPRIENFRIMQFIFLLTFLLSDPANDD